MAQTAAALHEEYGSSVATSSMGSRGKSLKNASRQYKQLIGKFNFQLPVPISVHRHVGNAGAVVELPFLKPSDVVAVLMRMFPWVLLAGHCVQEAPALLRTFWESYRKFQPWHPVYEDLDADNGFTIPLVLHGDGARTQRKQPLEVVSLEAVLGVDTAVGCRAKCTCGCKRRYGGSDSSNPYSMLLNHKHSSFASRFLLFAFNSKKYPMAPELLRSMLATVSADLGKLAAEGFDMDGKRWKVAVLGMKGDLEYHQKTGLLTRSYLNVGTVRSLPCCHVCSAGLARHPFEDVSEGASWVSTIHARPGPWTRPPPFEGIPFGDWTCAADARVASWFRLDAFHVFRLGIARNFIASTILLLCFEGFFEPQAPGGKKLEGQLVTAWAWFQLFCNVEGAKAQGLRSFSRDRLHFKKANSFPHITGKGSDSVLILKFLRWFVALQLQEDLGDRLRRMLGHVLDGCVNGLLFTQSIHRHGLFTHPDCALQIKGFIQKFGNAYVHLAQLSLQRRWTLYSMVPKIHSLMHFRTDLAHGCQKGGPVLNVALFDCSMNEDFVGRVARQSRRISNKNVEHGLLRAYLVKTKFVLKKLRSERRT